MHIMKFGGTSLGNAARIAATCALVSERARTSRVGLVVSALSGVTNFLVECKDSALAGRDFAPLLGRFREHHLGEIDALAREFPALDAAVLRRFVLERAEQLALWLDGIAKLGVAPDSVVARILALGEQCSVRIVEQVLLAQGQSLSRIEAEDFIPTIGPLLEASPVLEELPRRFAALKADSVRIVLMPGFIGRDVGGQPSLLGRNGSDYSGALMAYGVEAELCEIWTDVDGVYTADPRRVADAKLIEEMSYEEAMELSFFGAKVLHPKTIAPIARHRIPTLIRNTFNPSAPGTRIHAGAKQTNGPVRGLSCLEGVSLIDVGGSGMKGVSGMAARLFSAVSRRAISVILITQASSEYSISFCVADGDALPALAAIREEFELEIGARLLEAPECRPGLAVLCAVGDGMRERRGVAGRLFSALASADVNVMAISQGSSERAISAVIAGADSPRALQSVHQFFFNTTQRIDLFLLGAGSVGSALLTQVAAQKAALARQKIELRVLAVANSRRMLLDEQGIGLDGWCDALAASPRNADIGVMLDFVQRVKPLNGVLVDCSSDAGIAGRYPEFFRAGLHVATPNKKANTADLGYYRELRRVANHQARRFLYETTVGAGLPVIDTLQNLLKSGDRLVGFSGILSGSLSFVFGLLEEGISFSEAVRIARERGFTEPDPRDDLSGMDVARKLLILLREAGGAQELADIEIAPLFPPGFELDGSVADFLARLSELDAWFAERVARLAAEGKVLRFAGEIREGRGRVGLIEVGQKHPLYPIKGGENALAFETLRYAPIPLVIRGYGAGAEVTAAGVFGDVLRTVSFNPAGEALA
ncbi:MAG: bifunctional aspartate kinase/homoserine dehydrogenase I [Gammaproteobacteria bacterium]|nr:bifunctional aspartate kinase/homoserine dehydrogenase I [Gammaproteobacteria bacterium]